MRTSFAARAAAVALLGVVVLTACTGPTVTPTPDDTAVASPAPSPTPTPTATVDPSDPAFWTIEFGSIGPIAVGGTVADAEPLLTSFEIVREPTCPWYVMVTRSDAVINILQGDDDVIDLIAVGNGGPPISGWLRMPTDAGISIGSTEAELLAAYPGVVGTEGKYDMTHYSTTDDRGNFINFSVENASGVVVIIVTSTDAGIPPEYCG